MKGISSKNIALKIDVIGLENTCMVCRCIPVSFSLEIVQAGAVKGLIVHIYKKLYCELKVMKQH